MSSEEPKNFYIFFLYVLLGFYKLERHEQFKINNSEASLGFLIPTNSNSLTVSDGIAGKRKQFEISPEFPLRNCNRLFRNIRFRKFEVVRQASVA